MNKLKMKARSGVTLVELLVVILIVTILSVSMLPLLQPFVVESQYAAEAIPVIGNLRTKIGVYQYDKGKLPCIAMKEKKVTGEDGKESTVSTPQIETWMPVASATDTSAGDASVVDLFRMAYGDFPSDTTYPSLKPVTDPKSETHFGALCDFDYQELKGKRSKPHHYQYLVLQNGTDYAYFLGCFGDGNGLKAGTGYAVCEIVAKGHKYVGTWRRYKALSGENAVNQLFFTSSVILANPNDPDQKHTAGCYVPDTTTMSGADDDGSGTLDVIGTMTTRGWEF